MSEIEDVYALERIDQLRAIADELRQRILQVLTARPMTVTQIGDMLGHAPAKILYHVRELDRVGLVRLVEKRERGGILEKYYRAVAQTLTVPPSLLTGPSSDEQVDAIETLLQDISDGLVRALSPRAEGGRKRAYFMRASAWMTDEEAKAVAAQMAALLDAYVVPRGIEGERELLVSTVQYEPRPDTPGEPDTEGPGRHPRTVSIGVQQYSRADLERVAQRGESLDVTVFGTVTFADDIPPELVGRTIHRFHHRGTLHAPAEVRAVLRTREADPADT